MTTRAIHRPVAAVVNPVKVDDPELLRRMLQKRCDEDGRKLLWLETHKSDAGYMQAREALTAGASLVLACGGDGTVRAVADALADSGVPLAIVPEGTGNLLARNLGLPTNDSDALDVAFTGRSRSLDMGLVESGIEPIVGSGGFVAMAGMGLDAAIIENTPEDLKARVGWVAYVVAGVRTLWSQRAFDVALVVDGQLHRMRARTVLVANVGRLQGGLELAPEAVCDDGVLNVVVVAPRGVVDWLTIALRVLTRSPRQDEMLARMKGRSIALRATQPQPRQVDGEEIRHGGSLMVTVRPGALKVLVPKEERS